MNEQMEATVKLVNQKIRLTGSSRNNPEITMDYFPPYGDGDGYTGLELLLVSLGGCSSTAIVFLLRKMSKTVSDFRVNLKGIRREQAPLSFKEIYIEFILESDNTKDAELQKAIQISEESFCPVWAMIKNSVVIKTNFKIISNAEVKN